MGSLDLVHDLGVDFAADRGVLGLEDDAAPLGVLADDVGGLVAFLADLPCPPAIADE